MDLPSDDRTLADLLSDTLRKSGRCTIDRYSSKLGTCTEVERTAFAVWESSTMVCLGGFLMLITNDADLSSCADSYERIGMDEVAGLFREVADAIPDRFKDQRYEDIVVEFDDWTQDESVYDRFRSLDHRYFALTAGETIPKALSSYVRKRRDQLSL